MRSDPAIDKLATALGPTYTGIKQFGVGGQARLYTAHDALLNRDLAIKVLGPIQGDRDRAAKRLSREAQVVARFNHPNIVPIYFAGQYELDGESRFYFAMKLIDGPSLDAVGAFAPMDTIRILRDVALALDHAHEQGVYHRDIKPPNICLEKETKRPVVLDFGIAAVTGAPVLTQSGERLGTLTYMSPEQITGGKTADPRVDIYAVGEIGFRMLTGQDPFLQELTYAALEYKKRDWTKRELERLVPDASDKLVATIARCLSWNAEARYQTAAGLARELESMLPTISKDALFGSIQSREIDVRRWATFGVRAGLPPPPSADFHDMSVYVLHDWLVAFGYESIPQVRSRLETLESSAPSVIQEFVASCEIEDPPYAVGVDVIRIVLGIDKRATIHYPNLGPDDRITRQLRRFLTRVVAHEAAKGGVGA